MKPITKQKYLYADKPGPITEFMVYVEKLLKFKNVTMIDLIGFLHEIKDDQTSPLSQLGKFYCTKIVLSRIYYKSNY